MLWCGQENFVSVFWEDRVARCYRIKDTRRANSTTGHEEIRKKFQARKRVAELDHYLITYHARFLRPRY